MEYYPKKNIWKWILLYILIGAIAYGLMYYFFFSKNGNSYNPQSYQIQNNSQIANGKISEQNAINLVKNLPEVKNWVSLFNKPDGTSSIGGKLTIEVDHQDSTTYVVHAYEIVNNHTVTHNWYDVDKKTGNIKPEF